MKMEFRTRLTELLGTRYPVIQGALNWLSRAELVAAVSEAGGLGTLVASMFPDPEALREEIRKVRELTRKPFSVNLTIPLIPEDRLWKFIGVLLEEGVPVIETAGRNPAPYIGKLREAGAKLLHKVARVRDAMAAERLGVDAVEVVGYETGGLPGPEDVTTFVRIPIVTSRVRVPVAAGGGIGDARGFVAALALGAEGVVMGTRFVLSKECPAPPRIKEWLIRASEGDTVVLGRMLRVTSTPGAKKLAELEREGVPPEEILRRVRIKETYEREDMEEGMIPCGQVVGLLDRELSVREIIEGMIEEAERIIRGRLLNFISSAQR